MGGGIAMNFANAGIPVTVVEVAQDALDRGLAVVRKIYAATVEKGRLSQADMDKRMGLITGSLDRGAVREADIVIEAVFEEMGVKKEVFAALDKIAKPGAVLASNTSTLDIDQIASATSRPDAVIGTHFFSPANVMRLLELVRGAKTSKETIATSAELARRIAKVWVLAGNCDGFIGNRMLHPYLREAEFLVEEGATPQQVDKVIYDFGFAMGPFAMQDRRASTSAGASARARPPRGRTVTRRWATGSASRDASARRAPAGTAATPARGRQARPEVEAVIAAAAKGRRRRAAESVTTRISAVPVGPRQRGCAHPRGGHRAPLSDIDVTYLYGYASRATAGPMFTPTRSASKVYSDVAAFTPATASPGRPRAPRAAPASKELPRCLTHGGPCYQRSASGAAPRTS
jgi:3-hydroxyacyl-CoA dehydrogenase